MGRLRALVHLVTGETIDLKTTGFLVWSHDGSMADASVDVYDRDPFFGEQIESVDVIARRRDALVVLTSHRHSLHSGRVELGMRKVSIDDPPRRGSISVERTFENLLAFFDRLVKNDWSDRATGKLAPKYRDDDEEEEDEDEDAA